MESNSLKVFESAEFGELGVMTVDGREYFPATKCAKILGYKEPEKAIREKCKGVSKMDTPTSGGIQRVNYIPEGDLYRLIVSSKLPAAERFERWVFDEVLPGIRRTGGYSLDAEKLITQTAVAVAAQIAKQFIPYAAQEMQSRYPAERSSVRGRKDTSKISKLPPHIKLVVHSMMDANATYLEIQQYLDSVGVAVSQAAIFNYYHKYLELEETKS